MTIGSVSIPIKLGLPVVAAPNRLESKARSGTGSGLGKHDHHLRFIFETIIEICGLKRLQDIKR